MHGTALAHARWPARRTDARPRAAAPPPAPRLLLCPRTFFRRGSSTARSVEAPSCLDCSTAAAAAARGAASVSAAPLLLLLLPASFCCSARIRCRRGRPWGLGRNEARRGAQCPKVGASAGRPVRAIVK